MLDLTSFEPCQELRPFVTRYFLVASQLKDGSIQNLIPSDVQCLCFSLNEGSRQGLFNQEGYREAVGDYIVGQLSMPSQNINYGNPVILGVQFKSYGMFALFGIPMSSFTDRPVSIDDISNVRERSLISRWMPNSSKAVLLPQIRAVIIEK